MIAAWFSSSQKKEETLLLRSFMIEVLGSPDVTLCPQGVTKRPALPLFGEISALRPRGNQRGAETSAGVLLLR